MNNKLGVEIIEPTELAGKTVIIRESKPYRYPEPYNYKITGIGSNYENSLFYKLFNAFNNNLFLFIEYLIRYADKNNIVLIDFEKVMHYLQIDKSTIYRWIKRLQEVDFLVKVSKNKYMINPMTIINYRKTKNKRLGSLFEQYQIYKNLIREKK